MTDSELTEQINENNRQNPFTVTNEAIEALLDCCTKEEFIAHGKDMTVSYLLPCGFTVVGRCAIVNPKFFNLEIGRNLCRENAKKELWQLEGYRMQLKMYEATIDAND